MPSKAVPCAALMCHAPIVVPAVGGRRGALVEATTASMREAAQRIVRHRPDLVVVVSPHTPRLPHAFGVVTARAIVGDLASFQAPDVGVCLPTCARALELLAHAAKRERIDVEPLALTTLDHGAMVPLAFLWEAGWRGRTLLFAFPRAATTSSCVALGRAIRAAAEAAGERWALCASGDMSHRLTPGAPSGYHPDAHRFDEAVVARVAANDLAGAVHVDEELRELAGEDVIESLAVALGVLGDAGARHEVLSYEGPFGVGYLVAMLHDPPDAAALSKGDDEHALLDVGRKAIERALAGGLYRPPLTFRPERRPAGVFVTLWAPGKKLRGCVGRMDIGELPLEEAVASCAVSAATRDPRFSPLTSRELPFCSLEVSLLGHEEPARGAADLDPARYGVVVRSGDRAGVLLPGIEGIDTAEEQLAAVLAKAGIGEGASYELKRFPSRKIKA